MLAILVVMLRIYQQTASRARLAAVGLALACGGAIGNIFDRLRYARGVVDFIDVGIGLHRLWIFNVADAGITVGACLLAITLIRQDVVLARSQKRAV